MEKEEGETEGHTHSTEQVFKTQKEFWFYLDSNWGHGKMSVFPIEYLLKHIGGIQVFLYSGSTHILEISRLVYKKNQSIRGKWFNGISHTFKTKTHEYSIFQQKIINSAGTRPLIIIHSFVKFWCS